MPETNLSRCLADHDAGRVIVSGTPDMLTIESTAICNLRCVMCPQSIGAVERPKHMSAALGASLEPFIVAAGRIQLHGIGEPMTSPAFWRFVDQLPPAASVEVNSNFTILDAARIEKLVSSRLALINVSLDAASAPTYRRIRNHDFAVVVGHVRDFIAHRNARGRTTPRIRLNMTLMRENIAEVVNFVEMAHRLGVDGVEMWQLNVLEAEEMKRYQHTRGDWQFRYAEQVLGRYRSLSNRWVRRAVARARELGVVLEFPDTDRPVLFPSLPASLLGWMLGRVRQRVTTRDCRNPWHWLMVTSNGGARPCCYATSDVGNLEQMDVQEVWNGMPMQQVRRELLAGGIPHICRGAACKYVRNMTGTPLARVRGARDRACDFLRRAWRGLLRRLRT